MIIEAAPPPEAVAVALKEWAGIVHALGEGEQTILLRNGGIDEGPGGFHPEHAWFWFYPTAVHQAQQGLKPRYGRVPAPPDPGLVPLRLLANAVRVERLDDLELVDRFDLLHGWTDETIHTRFSYRLPGLWLLVVRVYALREPFALAVSPEHAGCRSWVPLPSACSTWGARPVLGGRRFFEECLLIDAALDRRSF